MNRKYLGILIIIIGLLLLIGIVYIIFFHKFAPSEEEKIEKEEITQPTATPEEKKTAPAGEKVVIEYRPLLSAKAREEDLKRMASSFAERFGSYSNQSNYGNIQDLKMFMTSKMKEWADSYIAEAIARKSDSSIYYGITTRTVSAEIKKFSEEEGAAEILVKTQRREATGTTGNTASFPQDILVIFIKESGVWKVAGAYWQGR